MASRLAIVGLGCILPGARTPDEFWELLVSRASAVRPLPPERFDLEALSSELPTRLTRAPKAGLIGDVDLRFEGLRLPPRQLEQLHQLEKAALAAMIQALNDAGLRPGSDIGKRVQVIVGATTLGADTRTDQRRRIYRFAIADRILASITEVVHDGVDELRQRIDASLDQAAPPVILDSLATSASLIAGRICNAFDVQGGHLVVDAGPASSLAALDLAVTSLADGECDVALVCGISPFVSASRVLSLMHSGRLEKGPPPGEGSVAVVVVREPRPDGLRQPYALLDGVGSYSVSGGPSLHEAVASAGRLVLRRAGLESASVDFVEHGRSGSSALDEAALRALREVYARPGANVTLTSSEDSVGCLDSAAGLVGVLKASLALEHRTWPGASDAPVQWTEPRRAAVSDAGFAPMTYHALLCSPDSPTFAPSPIARRDLADEGVAIVGIGVVVPGAANAATFWRNTLAGVDAIHDLPTERWDMDRLISGSTELRDLLQTRLAGTVDLPAVLERAATLVGKPVEDLEPGAALGLVACTEALEDARIRRNYDADRVMVVLGQLPLRPWESRAEVRVLFLEYVQRAVHVLREAGMAESVVQRVRARAVADFDRAAPDRRDSDPLVFSGVGTPALVAAAHGFMGGVLSVDAACASSLAALQIGVRKLLDGDADVVVAGGVAFNLLPEYYIGLSMLGILSRFGATPFHVGADGFVPAEGAGAVVLKRLSDARQAGDKVYAIIRGIGSSSDGRGPSIFVPKTEAQQRAMLQALSASGLDADLVDLVEAHGVGTEAGDRAESASYRAVYGQRNRAGPLYIGTTKGHIGYLSCAAPAVSLVKVALALREQILPTGALGDDGRAVMLPEDSVRLLRAAREWTAPPFRRRRAAISGIGLGGINYHVVLEEPDPGLRAAGGDLDRTTLPSIRQRASRWMTEVVPVALPHRGASVSLAGAHVLLIRDRGDVWRVVAHALERRGARVTPIDADAPYPPVTDVRGIFDLSELTLDDARVDLAPEHILRAATTTFDVLRAVYPRMGADSSKRGWYATAVSLGGDLGLSGRSVEPMGARFIGLARALQRELPFVQCKVVDFAPESTAAVIAGALISEAESSDAQVAVAYATDRRWVPRLQLIPEMPSADRAVWLPESTRCLMSGGGRGILFHCALALRKLGAKVVVSGRTRQPSQDAPWLALDDQAFDEYRRAEMLAAWHRDRMTPVQFMSAFAEIEHQRDLHHNLNLARGLGLALDYEVCDVTDLQQVHRLVAATRARWSGIDLVVHGAMVERSSALEQKTSELVTSTFATKVVGLVNLIDAAREEQPRFVCFGSVAGVFGNAGQTDHAAADTLMSAILAWRCRSPGQGVTINWPAWRQVGAAAANADIEARLQAAGVTAIWPDEGVYWFLRQVVAGTSGQVAILDEEMLNRWAWSPQTTERAELDDTGRPLLAGRWPMVDLVERSVDDRVVVRRTLDPASDRFLLQHRLRGVPTLPFTFGCELMAEAAELACPGFVLKSLLDVRVDSPLKHFALKSEDVSIRVSIIESAGDRRLVETVIVSDLRVGDRVAPGARIHYSGRAVLNRQRSSLPAAQLDDTPRDVDGFMHARSFFHLMKDPILVGPLFDHAAWLRVSEKQITGTVQIRHQSDALLRTSSPRFRLDPFGIDAALQIAASWDGYRHGWLSVPIAIERLDLGASWQAGDRIHVRANVVHADSDDVVYAIVGTSDDDRVLFTIDGLRQRRFAQAGAR